MVIFAQIFPKQALKDTIFFNFQKGQKMAKWPNHFISGKQFQKRPNGNPGKWVDLSYCPKNNNLWHPTR